MRNIGRHFIVASIAGIILLFLYKGIYSFAASNGYLGDQALTKYEHQTVRGKDALSMLMEGRKPFFIGLLAAIDRPIVGHGPRAEDRNGYAGRFLTKYGSDYDIAQYNSIHYFRMMRGVLPEIPTHSHILAGWVWCGILGLVFFIWVLYRMYVHVRYFMACIPQWYGFFALTIPSTAWSIMFNPYGARWALPQLLICMFLAKGVGEGRIKLSPDLEAEAVQYEHL